VGPRAGVDGSPDHPANIQTMLFWPIQLMTSLPNTYKYTQK